MKKTGIVLVHGMGPQQQGWSNSIQDVLMKELPGYNIEPIIRETLYSDLVEEGKRKLKRALRREMKGFLSPDLEAITAFHKLELTMSGIVNIQSTAGGIGIRDMQKGIKWLKEFFTYVVGYLGYPDIKEKINNRILSELSNLAKIVEDGNLILVGHSLGSVVSWVVTTDKSSQLGTSLNKLVTLGSPLGLLELVRVIQSQKVPCYWSNVVAPGDIVSLVPVNDPPFTSEKGLVTLSVRKFEGDPHGSLVSDHNVIRDWLPLLI